jgi:hypothetical protein
MVATIDATMREIHISIFLAVVLLGSSRAPAQTTRSDEQDLKQAAQADIDKEMRSLPYLGEHDLSEVLTFDMRDGRLYPVTRLPVSGEGYVKIKGLGGEAKVRVLGRQTLQTAGAQRYLQFVYRDAGAPGAISVSTEVYSSPMVVNVSREAELADDAMTSVQLIQSAAAENDAYIQTVRSDDKPSPSRRISAASVAELAEKDPPDVDEYLRPIFRMLGQEQVVFNVDDRTAYQVMADLCPIDAATTKAVDAAVNGLGADSYDDREAAMGKLRALGEPAAIDLTRSAPGHLAAEQAMRINLFLAPYHPLPDEQARNLFMDVDFLLDCQFSADPAIRDMARRRYKKVTGKPILFDEHLSGRALDDAVTALRP